MKSSYNAFYFRSDPQQPEIESATEFVSGSEIRDPLFEESFDSVEPKIFRSVRSHRKNQRANGGYYVIVENVKWILRTFLNFFFISFV